MAHFYADVRGNRGTVSRLGSKGSGVVAHLGSWSGGVRVALAYNPTTDEDELTVELIPWQNGAGVRRMVFQGPVSGAR